MITRRIYNTGMPANQICSQTVEDFQFSIRLLDIARTLACYVAGRAYIVAE